MDAVIGGTHITSLPNLTSVRTEKLTTPCGDPSSAVSIGLIDGREIAVGHRDAAREARVSDALCQAQLSS